MTEYMLVPSTLVANIYAEENEGEENTGVASSTNLKCSIVEVIGRDDNRVWFVVSNYDILIGI